MALLVVDGAVESGVVKEDVINVGMIDSVDGLEVGAAEVCIFAAGTIGIAAVDAVVAAGADEVGAATVV